MANYNLSSVNNNFKILTGNFKTTFEKELINASIPQNERQLIIKAFGNSIDFKTLGYKDNYVITLSSSGSFISIEIDRGEIIYSVYKSSNEYVFSQQKALVDESTISVKGKIKEILWNSMIEAKIPPDIILSYTDIFAWDIDFLTEVRDGDEFGIVYSVKRNQKGKLISKKIVAAYYFGTITGRKFGIYYMGDYYNEAGETSRSFFLKAPLQYRRISSYFSHKRFHPVLKYVRPHLGIDYAAPFGTPISAVADGIVIYKGWKGGYGNYVEIKHQMGYVTSYGHLSRFAKIYVGKRIKQGEIIGYVGMSGIATGPHLDFRIKHNGKYINYLRIKKSSQKKLPKKDIIEIRNKISNYFPHIQI
ncbi:MAG: M23 family metallopeptidase [Elusimicrobiales bacterium]|nr:M23 family metallopeptidase [Elusimicrobiales bacterium]